MLLNQQHHLQRLIIEKRNNMIRFRFIKTLAILTLFISNSCHCKIMNMYLETLMQKAVLTEAQFKRFVFSSKTFIVSFEIPASLNRVNSEPDIQKFNREFGFNFKTKEYDFYWDDLFFSDSASYNVLKVNTNFVFSSNKLSRDAISLTDENPSNIVKYFSILLAATDCELQHFKVGKFIFPIITYNRGSFLYPYQIFSAIINKRNSNKKLYYCQTTITVSHLMSLSFEYFSEKPHLLQNVKNQIIAESIRLHKFNYSNTSIFDAFEVNSGFLDNPDAQ